MSSLPKEFVNAITNRESSSEKLIKTPLKDSEKIIKAPLKDSEITFPEGGLWGWLAVLGGFCLALATIGFISAWGTFQEYYTAVLLPHSSASSIAWIGSMQYSLIFLPGILAGRLFDLGYFRPSITSASVLFIVCNFLVAECRLYWHFLLCQGLGLGVASGLLYVPCVALVSQWFKVKRPIAFSIVSFGGSLGGIIYPIVFRNLLPNVGFKWTIRIIAVINTVMFLSANLFMRIRLPPAKTPWTSLANILTRTYIFYVLATFFAYLGLYTMLTFLSVSAVQIGINPSLAFYLVAVANAASLIGRILAAGLAMNYGPINVMAVLTLLCGAVTYIWPFVTSHASFIVITCFYGIFSASFVALFTVGVAQLGDTHDIGKRAGLQMSLMALGALAGPPISGTIVQKEGNFHGVGIYAGSTIVIAIILLMFVRFFALRRWIGGKI